MEVTRTSAPLGARVEGLDVTTVGPETMAELDRLFCAHHVLSFPRQQLNEGELLAFAGRWGELVCHPYNQRADHREMLELTNRGKRRNPNEHWHSDMSYNSAPPKLTMLYAVEAPEIGGDTAFANQHLAYAELSDGMRELIGDLRAVHTGEGLAGLYGEDPREAPRAEHPVVRTHDQTGERALYVCRAFTSRFVGMKTTESRGLLEYLFEHSARPDFQGRHHWRAGDVVMWDNRSVLHYAVHDHGDDPRSIWRVQVEGPVPT